MRPRGFDWDEFQTLKVKVDVHQTWGTDNDGLSLNFKANVWRQYPGVEYVLCVHISPCLEVREHRLDSIVNGELGTPRMDVTPIDRNSVVVFDAHRLLELPPDADLPAGFYDPVTIDLLAVVDRIVREDQGGGDDGGGVGDECKTSNTTANPGRKRPISAQRQYNSNRVGHKPSSSPKQRMLTFIS